jgi:hypothetical protein
MPQPKPIPSARLKDFSNARVSQDGAFATFRLNTTDGEAADIELMADEIGDIICYLCGIAEAAGKHRDHDAKTPKQVRNYLAPAEARAIGFGAADEDLSAAFPELPKVPTSDKPAMLAVRLAGFDLGFRIAEIRLGDLPSFLRLSADRIERSIREGS